MLLYLTRVTQYGSVRYYKILLSANLFGELFVLREYGNVAYKAPTGRLEKSFETLEKAKLYYENTRLLKEKRGYK